MAASDHLNGQQFYHTSNHAFEPGHELTREGAFAANYPHAAAKLEASKSDYGNGEVYYPDTWKHAPGYKTNNDNYPVENHLYYGDRSLLGAGSEMYGKHTYAVQPVTNAGRAAKTHQEDPNYTSEGMSGAYRTKGKLRVLHEVDQHGNKLET